MKPPAADVLEIVMVGAGARAAAWEAVVARSPRMLLVARVNRPGRVVDSTVPVHDDLDDAMKAHPEAAFLVALPPMSALSAALRLARAERGAVVQAPLSSSVASVPLPKNAASIHVALGWTTLGGVRFVEQFISREKPTRVTIETRGLPEEASGDLDEVVVHSAALVHRLFPKARLVSSARDDNGIAAELLDGDTRIRWLMRTVGLQVSVRVEGQKQSFLWRFGNGLETFSFTGSSQQQAPLPRAAPSGPERAVAQLLTRTNQTTLPDAQASMRLAVEVVSSLSRAQPPGRRRFAQSAATAIRRPDDILARLGLEGPMPPAEPAPVQKQTSAMGELWAFRAGLKPVAFLTLKPSQVEATLAQWPEVHVERRARRVFVDAQDRWVDRRDVGDERVELYLSHDPVAAQRAAEIQTLADPSEQLRTLGALMGYPPCCVEAFATQDDRANNTRNRYATAARTRTPTDWPWELNNLQQMFVPFFPCRYDCEPALRWARGAFAELEKQEPGTHASIRTSLSRAVLYFDNEHQVAFDGAMESDGRVLYRGAFAGALSSAGFARFAGVVASGNALRLTADELRVERDDASVATWRRSDPALGFIAPFSSVFSG